MKNLAALLGWIVLCFVAAGVGAIASANALDFYRELTQPGFAPLA